MIKYDYLIVGSGLYGSVAAYILTELGKKCLVIDKRNELGGNVYCEYKDGINIHKYGPHIFHTSNKNVWKFINKFAELTEEEEKRRESLLNLIREYSLDVSKVLNLCFL